MKKTLSLLLATMMVLSFSACNKNPQTESNESQATNNNVDWSTTNDKFASDISANTIEELEGIIAKDVENTINALNREWEPIAASVKTYGEYINNAEKIEAFYEKVTSESELANIRLQSYAIKYAELIMSSDMSKENKYDAFDDLCDYIYEDSADDLYDGIYEGLLENMYEVIYEDALDDSSSAPTYSDWSNARSKEYRNLSDARSDFYRSYSSARSDIYKFISRMRSEIWAGKIEEAQEIIDDYKADISKLKE